MFTNLYLKENDNIRALFHTFHHYETKDSIDVDSRIARSTKIIINQMITKPCSHS